ncbi:MAG: hypothetical protein PHZ26_04400 [Candidatus Gracilibacteria bacterium]|nr:hypothetical protein [Candidatus Gracilibacteria bacterium]MDD2908969.1 hypothetical protein [Candidatus Gracilibacteria bacterium]
MKSKIKKFFSNKYIKILYIFILSVLIVLFSLFIFKKIQINDRIIHNPLSNFNHKTSINDVNFIESWMTFKYINVIFKIPEEYLKTKLYIVDKKYPNIPLGKYARNSKIENTIFLNQVKELVLEYIKLNPTR